ncbi:aldehyde ferredoxin oxidoreductase N-terminal domain-containing protein, partial [Thermodesulfobacteriota bacterium]
GGHGMGSAIFFDLVKDKTIDGFDPKNVVTMMTSPLSGTLAPAASGRTEVQGIGVQSYPIGWFTRSNFGGRFSVLLKYAGWDGVVLQGKADQPVWLDIRNDKVTIRNCKDLSLWGTDTRKCQEIIWDYVTGAKSYGDWMKTGGPGGGQSTQRPAVLAIGPAGERLSRLACMIHDAGNASGQGGFGAVLGSKQLKAISVIGTGSVKVADPNGLMQSRLWIKNKYGFDINNLRQEPFPGCDFGPGRHPVPVMFWERDKGGQRPQACLGCQSGCRTRLESGLGNEASCVNTTFYYTTPVEIQYMSADMNNKLGLNVYPLRAGLDYIRALNKMGVLGPGKQINCDLDFNDYGSFEFLSRFLNMLAYRKGECGDTMADGFLRAAVKWGRAEEDLKTGILQTPYWGYPEHGYDPRAELEWGYGSILSDRDINEHCFNGLFWDPTFATVNKIPPKVPAEEAVRIHVEKMAPYQDDMKMLDFSSANMYSEHIAKLVSWHRHFTRFWKQSVLFCDFQWPDFINKYAPNKVGSAGEAEPVFYKAVTGKSLTFIEGLELGKKIWNLDNAIWTLQGRHRDMVHFAQYIYEQPLKAWIPVYLMPGIENGKWSYINLNGRFIDKAKFEEWKTKYYTLEGWSTATGRPTKKTLKSLGLRAAADELEARDLIGVA